MEIPDFFKINDWPLKKSITFFLTFTIIFDIIFLLNVYIFKIPIIPQLFGFLLITFIPGFIALGILKIHHIDRLKNIILVIGLSLSFTMIFGFFLNFFLPFIGIEKPFTSIPFFISFNVFILILIYVFYIRNRDFKSEDFLININLSLPLLFLILIPFISIFSAYLMTYYDTNVLSLILLFLISLFPILIIFNKIPKKLYPFLIFIISIAILYHIDLISNHLWGFDVFIESFSSNLVLETGVWESSLEHSSHPLLLITILIPSYSLLCNLNYVWVFKIIFPLLFSFTPVVLFLIYKKIKLDNYCFNSKLALLSVFVFIFFYGFFKDMPDKQYIAQLFLVLLLFIIVYNIPHMRIMAIIFSFSLVTSHYGITFLFLISLILTLILFYLFKGKNNSRLTSNFVILFSLISIGWYLYAASGIKMENIIRIGSYVLSNITEIFSPQIRSGASYLFFQTDSLTWLTYKIFQIFLQIFILIGLIKLLLSVIKNKIKNLEIPFLMLTFYFMLIIQITITYGMGFDRVLQITLLLLSPLAIIGLISIIRTITRILKLKNRYFIISKKIFAVFLMVFFLFNSGFLFYVVNDEIPPYSLAIKKDAGWPLYNESEIRGIKFLKSIEPSQNPAVINIWESIKSKDALLASEFFPMKNISLLSQNTLKLESSYIYLGSISTEKVDLGDEYINLNTTQFYFGLLSRSAKLYDARNSEIYSKI